MRFAPSFAASSLAAVSLAAVALLAGPAFAEDAVGVRLSVHDGYGRVVFEFPSPVEFTSERTGDSVVLHFPAGSVIPTAPGGTRNVSAVEGGQAVATLTVAPGARLRTMRFRNHVIVDVVNPPPTALSPNRRAAHPPAASLPPASTPAAPVASTAAPVPVPMPAPVPVAAPAPASAVPVRPAVEPGAQPEPRSTTAPLASEPVVLAATHVPSPPGTSGSTALLPFNATVSAAAFPHGREAWLVFDERRPLDLAALSDDPVLSTATVHLLPAATLLRLPIPPNRTLRLSRQTEGWSLTLADAPGALGPVVPQISSQRLVLPVTSPGQIVTVTDPDTGQNLLVGTLRDSGPGVPAAYRLPEFTVRPSWQGIVVEPFSDRTVLHTVADGFAIETGDALPPALDAASLLERAAVLTRRFDLPASPVVDLLRRLQVQVADQGKAPPQSRLLPRLAAAQTMIALGLGAEAQSLLRLAVAEDPRAADNPDLAGLTAVAALLSGRLNEADGLLNPALGGSDEVALWRAIRTASLQPGSPQAAPVFAATIGLVLSYPSTLRNRLLPLAAETMAAGGAADAVDALLAKLPDEKPLDLVRAMRLEAKGDAPAALTLYDALTAGQDRLVSARAGMRAAMLRLSNGTTSPAEAADTLDRGLFAWRGDNRERDLRLQVATLRAQAGQWRPAFTVLRETAALFPDSVSLIQARTASLVTDLLRDSNAKQIAPLDLVALAEENADAMTQAHGSAALLADKLAALDLPRRADPIIERMAAALPPGAERATIGARLAAMRLDEGEAAAAAAAAALSTTDAAGLPAPLMEERGLLDARIHASAHDLGAAVAILSRLGTPAADDLRATVLGETGDWHGSAAALTSYAARTVPQDGALSSGEQDTLIRLASAQAHDGNDAALHALGIKEAARMTGPRADMFRLLTAAPIGSVGDLHRSSGEMALARAIPAGLAAVGVH